MLFGKVVDYCCCSWLLVLDSRILSTLNAGSLKELRQLQTIGSKRAELILNYREHVGQFVEVIDCHFFRLTTFVVCFYFICCWLTCLCLGGAWEARNGSSLWILLRVARSCAVLVSSWIVILSDSTSSSIQSSRLLFGLPLLLFPCT